MLSTVTIAITRHDEPDSQLLGALDCLKHQSKVHASVLVLDQCASAETEQYCAARTGGDVSFRYYPVQPCGISRARNEAISLCNTDILLFSEPDARADVNWAYHLYDTLSGGAAIVGGRILPDWECRPPIGAATWPTMDLYSLLDLGEDRRKYTKVVGCNFGINIASLGAGQAYFDENFGRIPGTLGDGEEMELCNRAINAGLPLIYDGRALVRHRIGKERTSYRWLARRIHAAGKSRAMQGGAPKPTNPIALHWASLLILPLYVFYLLGFLSQKYQARHLVGSSGE